MKKVITASTDGWDEDATYDVVAVCDKIYDLNYELKNCVRGAYSYAKTYSELGDYIIQLGEDLIEAGENIKYEID